MDIKEKVKLNQWAQDMADQKASGMTQKEWCKFQGIGTTTFEYRCKRVRDAAEKLQQNTFELRPAVSTDMAVPVFEKIDIPSKESPTSMGIHLETKDISIDFGPSSNNEHIKIVLEALLHA